MIIGVDPHKSTHTATAVDAATNTAVASVRVAASAAGYRRLLGWLSSLASAAGRWRTPGAWAVIWRSGSSHTARRCWTPPRQRRRGCVSCLGAGGARTT